MPPFLLNLLYVPAALLYLPLLVYQMVVLKKNRRGWRERFGGVARRTGDGPCVWIHAVSLGEVNATQRLVAEIESRLTGCEVVLSATTDTGYAAARRLYPDRHVFRFPLDFSFVVNRLFDRIRPSAVVLMELEVWPNFIELAARRGICVGIANGRVTAEKSMRRFGRPIIRSLARAMFRRIGWVGAQNETYAERFRLLGARSEAVRVTGTMKYDTAEIADSLPGDAALAQALGIDRASPVLVASSTGPGEEAMVLAAYAELRRAQPALQLVIVPRKPERFDEVARLIEGRGHTCVRRSALPDGGDGRPIASGGRDLADGANDAAAPAVFLGDTMGELRKFYCLADVVFVGRTLVPLGGSDLMEVAALGKAMCYGPHVENFAEVSAKLQAAGAAVIVPGEAELASTLRMLLGDKSKGKAMGRRAQDIVRQNTGATRRTVDLLCAAIGAGH
jgi:3-deoxy-D-manno-octulosonic-acid transferase